MKTAKDFTIFGVFIPAGTPVRETNSCAVIARYDESEGCRFDKRANYAKPSHNTAIAIPWSYTDEAELDRVIDEASYQ